MSSGQRQLEPCPAGRSRGLCAQASTAARRSAGKRPHSLEEARTPPSACAAICPHNDEQQEVTRVLSVSHTPLTPSSRQPVTGRTEPSCPRRRKIHMCQPRKATGLATDTVRRGHGWAQTPDVLTLSSGLCRPLAAARCGSICAPPAKGPGYTQIHMWDKEHLDTRVPQSRSP